MSDSQRPVSKHIPIETHRQLAGFQREIFRRLNADPQLAKLMLVNPAKTLQEIGFRPSREVSRHVLHTLQYPPNLRQRREQLEKKIEQTLNVKPRPNDPVWVSCFLFEMLQLQPLETDGFTPTYVAPVNDQVMERLQDLRPKPRGLRYQTTEKSAEQTLGKPSTESPIQSPSGTMMRLMSAPQRSRRLDLDAVLPEIPVACEVPHRVELETLYFYKDTHPIVRDVLALGIIQRQAFPIQTTDSYRRIRQGQKRNPFYAWINNVRFPVRDHGEMASSDIEIPTAEQLDSDEEHNS